MRFNTRSRWNTRRLRCDWTGYARRWVSFYFHIFCKSTNVLVFCVQAIVVLAECWLAMSAAQGPDGIRANGGGVRRDGYAAMAKEAEAYEMTAKVYASMGEKYIGRRNASARKWRECRRKSTRLARIRAGAGGDASVHFGGVGSFPAPQAVAV